MKTNRLRTLPAPSEETELLLLGDRVSALWNVGNYDCRQAFFQGEAVPGYSALCARIKPHPVYRALPSDIAQEVLKKLAEAWKSFFSLREKWNAGSLPDKPGLVRYRKNKDGSRPCDLIPLKHPRSYEVSPQTVSLPLPRDRRTSQGRLSLSSRGVVRFLGDSGRAEVSFDAGRGRWYFSYAVEVKDNQTKPWVKSAAIDLGVRILVSLSREGVDQALHFLGREVLKDWDHAGRGLASYQQKLSRRKKGLRSSKKLRRFYQRRKARLVAAWEALAGRVVARLRVEKVGIVCLGWPKGILRETSYSKLWNGRLHAFWSFDLALGILEKHLSRAGIVATRVGERGSSSHCPFCQSANVVRKPRHVLSCRTCGKKLHADQAGSRNILKFENPRISWDGLEASLKPETYRWNFQRWVSASNRSQLRAPLSDKDLGIPVL